MQQHMQQQQQQQQPQQQGGSESGSVRQTPAHSRGGSGQGSNLGSGRRLNMGRVPIANLATLMMEDYGGPGGKESLLNHRVKVSLSLRQENPVHTWRDKLLNKIKQIAAE